MMRFVVCLVRRPDQRTDEFRRELDASELMPLLERVRVHSGATHLARTFRLETDFSEYLPLGRQAEGHCDAMIELQWAPGTRPMLSRDDPVLVELIGEIRAVSAVVFDRSRSFAVFLGD